MAVLRLDHVPEAVGLTLPLYMILPDPAKMAGAPLAGRKVLYLLHGLSDDGSAWQRYTSIEYVANAYGLVVVMPSAGRSFYTDQPNGARYFTYLTAELPRYLGEVFNLHPRREDTFIAGNSMGGYGAIKAALLHPEMYAAAGSFSGVLTLAVFQLLPADDTRQLEFAQLFGDLGSLAGGEHDPAAWLESLVARGEPGLAPRLFLSVGRQEDIFPLTGMFHNLCQSKGVSSEYFEEDGRHDWFLWDRHIRRFLEFAIGPIPG